MVRICEACTFVNWDDNSTKCEVCGTTLPEVVNDNVESDNKPKPSESKVDAYDPQESNFQERYGEQIAAAERVGYQDTNDDCGKYRGWLLEIDYPKCLCISEEKWNEIFDSELNILAKTLRRILKDYKIYLTPLQREHLVGFIGYKKGTQEANERNQTRNAERSLRDEQNQAYQRSLEQDMLKNSSTEYSNAIITTGNNQNGDSKNKEEETSSIINEPPQEKPDQRTLAEERAVQFEALFRTKK